RLRRRSLDHRTADSRGLKIGVAEPYLLLLRTPVLVTPSECLADHERHESDTPPRRMGEAHVKKLVRRVGRVARWQGEARKPRRQPSRGGTAGTGLSVHGGGELQANNGLPRRKRLKVLVLH